ncbi:glutamate--putrescine ligase [Vibrio xiamenensis]|uniref:Glutamate--putrescine ligase n=1 Tax=Vibrio xiamenensis TaxID=861298 RepID=A0A1G7XVY2_9VIBR|nr:glutamine synthetase family protein [Vibrio xiamenensis]SDG76975.1 glutamine synthetase [Vibrio xiamenensis]SDG88329.1 glutamate--putrescine ligase [Vibrio xiamenensis]
MSQGRRKWMTQEDIPQAIAFAEQYPDVHSVDLILFDMNGMERGKRIPINMLPKVVENGLYMPASIFALDITGETVEETGLGFELGDGDRICRIVTNTLSLVPWKEGVAQAVLTMLDQDQTQGFFADPRHALRRQLNGLAEQELYPCVAVEFEFYLQDSELDSEGNPQPPLMPLSGKRMTQTQVYSLDELDEFRGFIDEVISVCETQNIPASNILAEYAPGQFEVNLHHNLDVMQACDQAMLMKRVVRAIAKKHGFEANFMAKPYSDYAGNGCHIHVSMQDRFGDNVFCQHEQMLKHAIGGVLAYMPETMAIIAPNANSYRRFQPNMFVSLWPNWGWDNRTVALRIPSGEAADTRLEHRLPGADCNPYLVVATILATIKEGLDNHIEPPLAVEGNAYELEGENFLPISWPQALERFEHSDVLKKRLTPEFCHVYHQSKHSEQVNFFSQVSPLEYQWYL